MIRLFKHYIPYNVVLYGALDLILFACAGEAGWRLRGAQIGSAPGAFAERAIEILGFALVLGLALVAVGGYRPEALRSVRQATARLAVALALCVTALALANFLLPGSTLWRSILVIAVLVVVVIFPVLRALVGRMLGEEALLRRVLVLGAGDRAARLLALSRQPGSGFRVALFVKMTEAPQAVPGSVPRTQAGDLGRLAEEAGVSEVVVAIEERRNALPLPDLLKIKTRGVPIAEFASFLERETGRVDLDTVNPSWFIFSDGFSSGKALVRAGKRAFDIAVSLTVLVATLPLIAVFAVAVKLDSRGPALFRQTRVGLYGQPFVLRKLRSMRTDAEAGGARWAQERDPRITRVGRIIRATRIDELPQLWSVLKGDMSFVGPRPEVPVFVEQLAREIPFYAERHEVKPGITGWAQINYPYGASVADARHKLEYDLYYAKNTSLFLDIVILLQTARVILWRDGAR